MLDRYDTVILENLVLLVLSAYRGCLILVVTIQ